jgi:DNA polymerase elongation subunit (family B)
MNYSLASTEELEKELIKEEQAKNVHKNAQHIRKIYLNSLYGILANPWCRYYDQDAAGAVTHTGQFIVREMMQKLEDLFQSAYPTDRKTAPYVMYGDTDSCYITLDNLVEKSGFFTGNKEEIMEKLTKFCDEYVADNLTKIINNSMDDLNAKDRCYIAGREVIGGPGIWVGKKKYAIDVFNNEGIIYKEGKLKVMGLEMIKSSTPEWSRIRLEEAMRIMMYGTEKDLHEKIKLWINEYKSQSVFDIASPSGLSKLNEYIIENEGFTGISLDLKSGTPIAARAAFLHNLNLEDDDIINPIEEGDKIKYVYLKTPNPYGQGRIKDHVMGFNDGIPNFFNKEYIDYDLQLEKIFFKPLAIMIKALNWNIDSNDKPATLF